MEGVAELVPYAQLGGTAGIVAILLGFWLRFRKDDRDGWGVLIKALQDDVKLVREQHHDCEHRLAELESRMRPRRRSAKTTDAAQ